VTTNPTIRFDDRVVVITGAGGGLGRAYAHAFAGRGAKVVVNDLGVDISGVGRSAGPADAVVAEIVERGGTAVASHDSVTDGERIVQTAIAAFGRIDILINNAGILRDRSFKKMSAAEWDAVRQVHLDGAFSVTRAAWPLMLGQKYGRIVNTASPAGLYGNFGQANYAAAKAGLIGFTRALAIEGAASDITVNVIAPIAGSRLFATVSRPELLEALKPEHVAPLILRLCATHNRESGSVFEVAGGWMAKLRWERSRGASFDPSLDIDPEAVDAAWERICSFDDAEHPSNVREAAAPVLANVGLRPSGE
jgi:NAD(P)-dependent dehydrogenase (short-subunit alcohol dehydrogenase family)